ncbi:uncharacterized protein BDCG_08685 [Blastomyces dermatitidis ER-3]|uniref:Uncharacterized protein n=1 Tax=Ajellomyces dermatitidis (strain ER-3 / ATCC MYA-2586) TaxID=559297 RepID=A0ABP2ES81_AJEDR|nr:uncharacterized protein BDCG_08685 [Blastomyces dermatitidis ER-3]EEQ85416.2 hypothetical protein BDCG_08685 [Blastomyces dermatitidis ER-3]
MPQGKLLSWNKVVVSGEDQPEWAFNGDEVAQTSPTETARPRTGFFAGMKDPRQGREESASKPKRAVMVSGSMLCCCQRRRRQDELHTLKSADSKQPLLYYSTNTILQVTTALPGNRRPRLNWAADS